MVHGKIYYLSEEEFSGEIDESAILGYTESYTNTFPEKHGETNFNRELGCRMPEWKAVWLFLWMRSGICVIQWKNRWKQGIFAKLFLGLLQHNANLNFL